jgi:hypothetical protein
MSMLASSREFTRRVRDARARDAGFRVGAGVRDAKLGLLYRRWMLSEFANKSVESLLDWKSKLWVGKQKVFWFLCLVVLNGGRVFEVFTSVFTLAA